ncbi:MAG: GWxTD domain-containing protein, partial [Balneolales bacterium]|nr:GWxTD domain-containing protein [Balneolales bacterium]
MSRLLPILLFLVSFQYVQAQSPEEQDLFVNENHAILTEYEQRYQDGNDPEFTIGREYLRIVVEDSITQKIELASSIYYWGLNANDVERDAEALEEELQYIEAIMHEDRFEYLQTLFEQRDPQLFKELKTFWIEYDFSPGTVFNERLIEHVERINFARKNYIENNRNVYETDDRGLTYVKFGQPDRVFEGTLDVDLLNVEQFCNAFDRCVSIELFNFLFEIDPEPEYEIWVYRDLLNSRKKNAVFLFAKTMGHEFKRYQTIEELIPARAKSKEIGSVSGGMALSWIYYRQLMGVDPYFSETYAFVNEKFYRDKPGLGAQQGFLVEREVAWNTRQLTNDIPRQESTIERMVYSVPLEYYVYRRFNE